MKSEKSRYILKLHSFIIRSVDCAVSILNIWDLAVYVIFGI